MSEDEADPANEHGQSSGRSNSQNNGEGQAKSRGPVYKSLEVVGTRAAKSKQSGGSKTIVITEADMVDEPEAQQISVWKGKMKAKANLQDFMTNYTFITPLDGPGYPSHEDRSQRGSSLPEQVI